MKADKSFRPYLHYSTILDMGSDLPASARQVYAGLRQFSNSTETPCWPSTSKLAGGDRRVAIRALRHLQAAELIKIVQRVGTSSQYYLLPLPNAIREATRTYLTGLGKSAIYEYEWLGAQYRLPVGFHREALLTLQERSKASECRQELFRLINCFPGLSIWLKDPNNKLDPYYCELAYVRLLTRWLKNPPQVKLDSKWGEYVASSIQAEENALVEELASELSAQSKRGVTNVEGVTEMEGVTNIVGVTKVGGVTEMVQGEYHLCHPTSTTFVTPPVPPLSPKVLVHQVLVTEGESHQVPRSDSPPDGGSIGTPEGDQFDLGTPIQKDWDYMEDDAPLNEEPENEDRDQDNPDWNQDPEPTTPDWEKESEPEEEKDQDALIADRTGERDQDPNEKIGARNQESIPDGKIGTDRGCSIPDGKTGVDGLAEEIGSTGSLIAEELTAGVASLTRGADSLYGESPVNPNDPRPPRFSLIADRKSLSEKLEDLLAQQSGFKKWTTEWERLEGEIRRTMKKLEESCPDGETATTSPTNAPRTIPEYSGATEGRYAQQEAAVGILGARTGSFALLDE